MPPFTTKLEKPCDTTPKTMLMWFVHDKKINDLNHCNEVLNYLLQSIRYKKLSKNNESPSTIINQQHFICSLDLHLDLIHDLVLSSLTNKRSWGALRNLLNRASLAYV